MWHRSIEIHDSVLEKLTYSASEVLLHFSSAYIHQSEGVPGRDAGTGWVQQAVLRIGSPVVSGVFSVFPVKLSDGRLIIGELVADNIIPLPLRHEGAIRLTLETFRAVKEIVTFEGRGAEIELRGEPKYVEDFRPQGKP
jgi:hypothetical protein